MRNGKKVVEIENPKKFIKPIELPKPIEKPIPVEFPQKIEVVPLKTGAGDANQGSYSLPK